MEGYEQEKLARAKKRVDKIKGFYIHLAVYVLVNMFILVNIYLATSRQGESFGQWGHFFTAIFWGLGVIFHAFCVFRLNPFFGKNWEKKQIRNI